MYEWLNYHAYGYAGLSEAEVSAISNFGLLWSLFEARHLGTRASPAKLRQLVDRMEKDCLVSRAAFAEVESYFVQRYGTGEHSAERLEALRPNPGADLKLVLSVVRGQQVSPAEALTALLLIVYRLRNNLFHGEKWAYGIADQRANFEAASTLLMTVMDLNAVH